MANDPIFYLLFELKLSLIFIFTFENDQNLGLFWSPPNKLQNFSWSVKYTLWQSFGKFNSGLEK